MSYQINPTEFENILSLDDQKRFEHFIKRAADWEEVWGLVNEEGWFVSIPSNGLEATPFWPHPDYAKFYANHKMNGCQTQPIDLENFMEDWLPGFADQGKMICVFPTQNASGVCLSPLSLRQQLAKECRENYGDEYEADSE